MNPFRAIFSHPGTGGMTAAAFVGRFPMGMIGLAVTMLVVGATGSYALAGGMAAATTLSAAVGGPLGGRFADRYGQHRVIPPLLAVHVCSLVGLTLAVLGGWPTVLWFVLAGVAGLTGPNLGAMVRARWAGIVDGPAQLTSAFALESTLDEVAFVIGPPLATALAVAVAPWSAIATGVLLAASGGLALAAQRRTEPPPAPASHGGGPAIWRSRVLAVLTLLMVLMGAIFGALEVSTVAFAQEQGVVGATGGLLGAFALASMITGLVLGLRPGDWSIARQLAAGALMLAVATATLPFIATAWLYGVGMFASGLGVSAVMIGTFQFIERALPRERLTEALSLAVSGVMVGSSIAVALAGALIDAHDSTAGITVASVAAACGLILVAAASPMLHRSAPPDHEVAVAQGTPTGVTAGTPPVH